MIIEKDTATTVLVYCERLDETLVVQKPWADKGLHRAAYVQTHARTISPAKAEDYCNLILRAANVTARLNTEAGYTEG